jgi:nuclear GTP-binding protein
MAGDKKIILLLNKIDLVPVENAHQWQNYLRREYPTVLFKANLQNQQTHLSSNVLFKKSLMENSQVAEEMIKSSKSVGPDHLVQLIKQLSKVEGTNRAVTVGLIGYPNVGKSSVINSLKRTKACQVSSVAGSTKCLQEVKLDKQVKLLDCPGVIFEMQDKTNLILRNTLKLDDDLDEIVQAILEKVEHPQLLELYKIETFKGCEDFLAKVARSAGRLIKGGIPDFKKAAKMVVEDWNKGRIKYFTIPPNVTETVMEVEPLPQM